MVLKHNKEKGSRLERTFAKMIRNKGLDSNAKRMVLSGADWAFRTDIYTSLPFSFECKNQETMKFWEWWQQARDQGTIMKPAVLVHTANLRPTMVSMEANTFLDVLKEIKDLKEQIEDITQNCTGRCRQVKGKKTLTQL